MAAVQTYAAPAQIRPSNNKEVDWLGICENVYGPYGLGDDDVFGLDSQQRQSSLSDQSSTLFGYSISSGQSDQTTGTSPDPAWVETVAMAQAQCEGLPMYLLAQQPQAKQGHMQWERTVDHLEQSAAEINARQHKLRPSKSHPGFLSLGGNPSPPASCVPYPVPDVSLSIPRTRPHESANGKKRSTPQVRSASRGRPQGIAKNNSSNNNITMSQIRKRSCSPVKMMTPSRYRAGYQDAWADKLQTSPPKYALRMPTHGLPESPPASGHLLQQDFAAFGGSPTTSTASALLSGAYDSELSPLTTNFQQQARIHTPDASPFFTGAGQHSYLDAHGAYPSAHYTTQAVPLVNDVALTTNRIGSFDFGFDDSTTTGVWTTPTYHTSMPDYAAAALATQNVYGSIDHNTLPINQMSYGLGISCDTATLYTPTSTAHTYTLPPNLTAAVPIPSARSACYAPKLTNDPVPITPRKQMKQRSRSPSPPATEPRSRRASTGAGIRRASKHRRAKSATSFPRHIGGDKGSFVNFTPDDSGKILSGVAPSGSSKTKARREKEAAEKRRKLSLAAMKAVQDAGGDVEALASTGLIESM